MGNTVTPAERPDDSPCDSCRWRDGDCCTLRGPTRPIYVRTGRRGRPVALVDEAGEIVHEHRMPLPADRGASCPPRLWEPRRERWYESAAVLPSPAGWAALDLIETPPEDVTSRAEMVRWTRAMRRLGVPSESPERRGW